MDRLHQVLRNPRATLATALAADSHVARLPARLAHALRSSRGSPLETCINITQDQYRPVYIVGHVHVAHEDSRGRKCKAFHNLWVVTGHKY